MQAVILAGGKGVRMLQLTKTIPKPLIKVGGKPVIEHQIALLKEYGIKEIWILLGYLGDQIKSYLQDGKSHGLKIHYCQEKEPLGTAGALKVLENKIKEDFLVLSGDMMLDFDVQRFVNWHGNKGEKIASIIVHSSDHPLDSDLVEIDNTGIVRALFKRPHSPNLLFRNLSNASIYIFSPEIFKYIPDGQKTDIEKDIFPLLLETGEKIYAYNTPEYIKDMGTPERLEQVERDYDSGKIKGLNLKNKRKAVFLDRDGVINEEADQLSRLEDLRIYDFTAEAIKKVNNSGYFVILTTNQPMVAKGFMTEQELDRIHRKIETELGRQGAKIDAIYYCPHHPNKGFEGEIPELKIKCECRKPNIGMIKKAASDFNLDLKRCFLVGDSSVDAKTAENAGINFIGVKTGYACRDGKYAIRRDFPLYADLLEAVDSLLAVN